MKKKSDIRGFSLLEIMVVVAIVGIMAGSVVVGFNAFGNTIRTRETAGILTDLLKGFELETIRRDYQKLTIQFEPAYLVVEADAEGTTLPLEWTPNESECGSLSGSLDISGNDDPLYLAQNDQYGNRINTYDLQSSEEIKLCIPFMESKENEWQYQLFNDVATSQLLRFVHFNLRRDAGVPVLIDDNAIALRILAPYAKKILSNNGVPTDQPVMLTLSYEDDTENVVLQN